MTKDEIEKAAEEYAEKIYGVDSVPISWRQEDGFALLAKARQQIKEAVLFGAEHALPRWVSVEERLPDGFRWVLVASEFLGDKRYYTNIAMYDDDRWKYINANIGREEDFGTVRYWQPLPSTEGL